MFAVYVYTCVFDYASWVSNCCAKMSFAGNAMMAVSSQLSSQQVTPVVSCLDHLIKTQIALFFLTFPKMMQWTQDSSFLIWSSCTGMWWISIHDIWLDYLAVVTCCQVIKSIGFRDKLVSTWNGPCLLAENRRPTLPRWQSIPQDYPMTWNGLR